MRQREKPLVVVGSAPYAAKYTEKIDAEYAKNKKNIKLLGAVYDQDLLDQLYSGAFTYLHGHSVGGTNPSLLRAIGAGTAVIAKDVSFNRHIVREDGWYFSGSNQVDVALTEAEANPDRVSQVGQIIQDRASRQFSWDDVAKQYEQLAMDIASKTVTRLDRRYKRRKKQAVDPA